MINQGTKSPRTDVCLAIANLGEVGDDLYFTSRRGLAPILGGRLRTN